MRVRPHRADKQRAEKATIIKSTPSLPPTIPPLYSDESLEPDYIGFWDSVLSPDSSSSATASSSHTLLRTPPTAAERPMTPPVWKSPTQTPSQPSPVEYVHSSGASIRRIPVTNTPSRPHATYHLHFTPSGGIQSVPAAVPESEGTRKTLVRSISRRFGRSKRRAEKDRLKGMSSPVLDQDRLNTPPTPGASEAELARSPSSLISGNNLGLRDLPQLQRTPSPTPDLTETVKQRRERAAENAIQRMLEADHANREQVKQSIHHGRSRSATLSRAASSSVASTAGAPPLPWFPSSLSTGPNRSLSPCAAGPSHPIEPITPPPRSHSITPRAASPQPPPRSQSAAAGVFSASAFVSWPHAESSKSGALSDSGHTATFSARAKRDVPIALAPTYSVAASGSDTSHYHPHPRRAQTAPIMPLAPEFASSSTPPPPASRSHSSSSIRKKPGGPRSHSPTVPENASILSSSPRLAYLVAPPTADAGVAQAPSPVNLLPGRSPFSSTEPSTISSPSGVNRVPLRSLSTSSYSTSTSSNSTTPTSAVSLSSLGARAAVLSTPSRRAATTSEWQHQTMSAPRPQRSVSLSTAPPPRSASLPSMQSSPASVASSSPRTIQRSLAPVTEVEVEEIVIPGIPKAESVSVVEPREYIVSSPSTIPSPVRPVVELPTEPNDSADSASDSGSGPATPVDSHFSGSIFTGSPSPPSTPYASVQLARATTIRHATAAVFTRAVVKPDTEATDKDVVNSVRTVRSADVRAIPTEWSTPSEVKTIPIPIAEPRVTRLAPPPRPKLQITTNTGPRSLLPPPRRLSVSTSKSAPDMTRLALVQTDKRSRRDTFGITSLAEETVVDDSGSDSDELRSTPKERERSQRRRSRHRYRSEMQSVTDGVEKERILERLSRRPGARAKPWGYL